MTESVTILSLATIPERRTRDSNPQPVTRQLISNHLRGVPALRLRGKRRVFGRCFFRRGRSEARVCH